MNSVSKYCWKFLTLLSVSWGGKFLEFCEINPTLYNKILQTVVKCLCGWNCMTMYSFFPHFSLCLENKMNLLKKLLSSFNPCKQLFLCLQPWFGEATPPELNRCFRIFSSTINWRQIILQKKVKSPLFSSSQFCSNVMLFN